MTRIDRHRFSKQRSDRNDRPNIFLSLHCSASFPDRAERLEAAGHVNSNGRRFAAVSVRNGNCPQAQSQRMQALGHGNHLRALLGVREAALNLDPGGTLPVTRTAHLATVIALSNSATAPRI
jgi:hypothetical protein